ncbi:MAG: YcxB family protein, partial [Bacteroidota bacterium]
MKLNAREGMPMKWEQILRAKVGKDHFLLFVNKAQLIYWPYKIFASDNERKFVLSILRNRGLAK